MGKIVIRSRIVEGTVLKSYTPLEKSPNDRDGFIAKLKELNTAIIVEG